MSWLGRSSALGTGSAPAGFFSHSAYLDDSCRARPSSRALSAGGARRLQRDAEDVVRVAVDGVAADGLAQPVDGGLGVLLEPVGVAEIEEVVGFLGIELGRLGEVVGRLARLGRGGAPDLDHAEVVVERGGRPLVGQAAEGLEGLVEARELDQRSARQEARPAAERRRRGHRLRLGQRPRVIALIGVDLGQRQVGPGILRRDAQGRLQEPDLRRRLLGDQALDVVLEGAERQRAGRGGRRRGRAAGGRLLAHQATGQALVQGEELGQRRAVGRLLDQAAGVEADAPRVDDQLLAAQAHGADDRDRSPAPGGRRGPGWPATAGRRSAGSLPRRRGRARRASARAAASRAARRRAGPRRPRRATPRAGRDRRPRTARSASASCRAGSRSAARTLARSGPERTPAAGRRTGPARTALAG